MDASKVINDLASTTKSAMVLCNQLFAVGAFVSAASQDSARLADKIQSHWRILDQLSQRLDHNDSVHHQHALAVTGQIVSQTLITFQTIDKVAPLRRTSSPSSSVASSRASSSSSVASLASLASSASSSSSDAGNAVTNTKASSFSFFSSLSRPSSSSRSSSSRSIKTNSHSLPKNDRPSPSSKGTATSFTSDYVFPMRNRMLWRLKKVEIDSWIHQLEFLQRTTQLLVLVLTIGEKIKFTREFAKGGNSMQVMYEVLKVQGTPAKEYLLRDIKGLVSVMPMSDAKEIESVVALLPEFVRVLSQKYVEHGLLEEQTKTEGLQEWEVKEYSRENMRRWWTGLLLEWTTIR